MTVGDQPTITPAAATPVAVAAAARSALDAAAALPVDIAAAAKVLPKLHALALLSDSIPAPLHRTRRCSAATCAADGAAAACGSLPALAAAELPLHRRPALAAAAVLLLPRSTNPPGQRRWLAAAVLRGPPPVKNA